MSQKRIAIVTWDLQGPVKTGGIGTASAGLAEALAEAGHRVSICFLPSEAQQLSRFDHWVEFYAKKNIELLLVTQPVPMEALSGAKASYAVYEFLRTQFEESELDVIHFPDMRGLAFYTLKARTTLGRFAKTTMTTICHGSSAWHREYNEEDRPSIDQQELDYLERVCIEESDVVIAPTRFATERVRERFGKTIDAKVIPNIIPHHDLPRFTGRTKGFSEIVFLGRLELRKGLDVFVEAVKELGREFFAGKKIVFLGRVGTSAGRDSRSYIGDNLNESGIAYEIVDGLGSRAALDYLRNRNPLVVIPSRSETMGYTLHECLSFGIPVIASRIPAFEEAVGIGDHEELFFENTSSSLAKKIFRADEQGLRSVSRLVDDQAAREAWTSWHEAIEPKSSMKLSDTRPLVSVCISHRNRAGFLEAALGSLDHQTYSNFEILIGDDASDDPTTLEFLAELERRDSKQPRKVLRFSSKRGPGAVRNELARLAKGEFIHFMDDDNLAHANELETFVMAQARTGADILTCPFNRIREGRFVCRWLPLGPAKILGYFTNVFGDTNSLIRRSLFLDLGGFETTYGFGIEDWDLFMRASFHGAKHEIIPEPLVTYREHATNYSKSVDTRRSRNIFVDGYTRHADRDTMTQVTKILEFGERWWSDRYLPTFEDVRKAKASPAKVVFRPHFDRILGDTYVNDFIRAEVLGDDLFLEIKEDDGILELPAFEVPKRTKLQVKVDLHASRPSRFCVYTLGEGETTYTEDRCARFDFEVGENSFVLDLGDDVTGRVRIDPSEHEGTFVISSLVFREVPQHAT